MGTSFRLVIFGEDEAEAGKAARAAFDRVRDLNGIMSDWDGRSEVSRLSRSPCDRPVPVGDDLFEVLALSREVSQATEGAFDVTVGPFVRLWRRSRRSRTLPAPERLIKAREAVGYRYLELDPSGSRVVLARPGMRLDLGGIAKGHAGREALRVLADYGYPRALVDAGGDLALGAPPPGREGWDVGLLGLDPSSSDVEGVVLANVGVATSGAAFRFVEIDGLRYSHIVDPRTGLGLTEAVAVTVIASDPAVADAWSSALSVLGVRAGLALAQRTRAIEARFVTEDGVHHTDGFPRSLGAAR